MNQLQTEKAPLAAAAGKKNPDVIVTHANQTVLFTTQNHRVSEWLCGHYPLSAENVNGNAEIHVHPSRSKRIAGELKAAGFVVASEMGKLC